ncbi:MAG: mechanosensitive ion channel family protein, partial [Thermoplasmata archaeon]
MLSLLYVIGLMNILPIKFNRILYAVTIAVIVYVITQIVVRYFRGVFQKHHELSHLKYITFIVSFVGYFIIALAVLASLGIDVSSVILGSAFIGAIIGLAAQTVLANAFGGMMLLLTHPFKVDDFVVINTWQYGASLPSYPPKYFSRDFMEASIYRGIVSDISIMYTSIKMESGDTVKIPNGIIIQAAVSLRKGGVTVQARYEVPKTINFDTIKEKIADGIRGINNPKNLNVFIDETTLNTYIIGIRGDFESTESDLIRSSILKTVMSIVEPLKK